MKSQWQTHLWPSKLSFVLLLTNSFLVTACGGGGTAAMPAASKSVSISIMPSTATLAEGRSLSFVASVTGATDTTVLWSVQEGVTGGSVSSSGGYTASNSPGTYHVIATSSADPTATASAVVKVEAPSGAFALVGNMTTARAEHTATLLGNGKVLIAGGSGQGFAPLGSAELYDPSTRTFSSTGGMVTPRYYHSATLLADGRVLIAGGTRDVNAGYSVLTAEVYDPSTGTFASTGNLNLVGGSVFAFTGPVTALLPDGRVFVAGANNPEIYDPQ
ncbi:MAG TPA: kelch repeat-containing protein, partial [Acidobacteriaceae bacterium]|nr:kelch repeat-containing protein [Acidobacteriaceae bacterium]